MTIVEVCISRKQSPMEKQCEKNRNITTNTPNYIKEVNLHFQTTFKILECSIKIPCLSYAKKPFMVNTNKNINSNNIHMKQQRDNNTIIYSGI